MARRPTRYGAVPAPPGAAGQGDKAASSPTTRLRPPRLAAYSRASAVASRPRCWSSGLASSRHSGQRGFSKGRQSSPATVWPAVRCWPAWTRPALAGAALAPGLTARASPGHQPAPPAARPGAATRPGLGASAETAPTGPPCPPLECPTRAPGAPARACPGHRPAPPATRPPPDRAAPRPPPPAGRRRGRINPKYPSLGPDVKASQRTATNEKAPQCGAFRLFVRTFSNLAESLAGTEASERNSEIKHLCGSTARFFLKMPPRMPPIRQR